MKHLAQLIMVAWLLLPTSLFAQQAQEDTSYWHPGGYVDINFNQVGFTNWAQGGESSISIINQLGLKLRYEKGKNLWETSLDLGFGTVKSGDDWRKNEDKIDFVSKYGYQAKEQLFYSVILHLKSQFAEGFNYPNDSTVISDFMAPATVLASAGMDYKLLPFLSIYLSPATGKLTFITDDEVDETTYGLDKGDDVRVEFGAYFTSKFEKEILKNTTIKSKLELFNNYTDDNKENRDNIDINWETTINLKVNDYISANLFTHLIYDDDTDVPKTDDEGNRFMGKGPQFKEVFGAGFSYKF